MVPEEEFLLWMIAPRGVMSALQAGTGHLGRAADQICDVKIHLEYSCWHFPLFIRSGPVGLSIFPQLEVLCLVLQLSFLHCLRAIAVGERDLLRLSRRRSARYQAIMS